MARKHTNPIESTGQALVRRVRAAAKRARKSAKAVIHSKRTLPMPIEIEPRSVGSPGVRALKKERQRLLDELRHQEIVEQEHPTTGNHMADDASEVSEQAKTLALKRHLEGILTEIDEALARAQKGSYGVCERCGKPISPERLKVVPSANLCIDCAKLKCASPKLVHN